MRYDHGWRRIPGGLSYDRGYMQNAPPPSPRVVYQGVWDAPMPAAAPSGLRALPPRPFRRTDEELRDDVSELLFFDTWVDSDAIHVDAHDGVVVLRGSLPGYDEIRFAIADACDVEGVVGVRNELRFRRE